MYDLLRRKSTKYRKNSKFDEKSQIFKWPYLQFPCVPKTKTLKSPETNNLRYDSQLLSRGQKKKYILFFLGGLPPPQEKSKKVYWSEAEIIVEHSTGATKSLDESDEWNCKASVTCQACFKEKFCRVDPIQ